ncbi:hypothetical protein [Salinigranum halophilum]|uniref:hypothetical protein n=1 Tax=Salinigranum halophilum TaxID=2565931 RepID=UPI00115F1188|nr:hypothetical protein [Salinigranum halophilum]
MARYAFSTGLTRREFEPVTQLSAWMYSQTYDSGSMMYAIINIITGTSGSRSGIAFVRLVPFAGTLVIPALCLGWLSRVSIKNGSEMSLKHLFLILTFSLFPAESAIFIASNGYHPGGVALGVLVGAFIIVGSIQRIYRRFILLSVFSAAIASQYHTFALVFVLLLSGTFILDQIYVKLTGSTKRLVTWLEVMTFGVIYTSIGTFANNRVFEIVTRILFFTSPEGGGFDTVFINRFNESVTNIFTITRISTAISIVIAFIILASFMLLVIENMTKRGLNFLRTRHIRLAFLIVPAFIPMTVMLYLWGGFGPAITRTIYVGIWFVVLAAAILLVEGSTSVELGTVVAIVLVVSTVGIAVASQESFGTAEISVQQSDSVKFSGEYIHSEDYIFSDSRLGLALLYESHQAIIAVRPSNDPDFTKRLNSIYYNGTSSDGISSIKNISEAQTISQSEADDTYLLLSKDMQNGVEIFVTYAPPTEPNFYEKYDQDHQVRRIFSNGENIIYKIPN